MPKKRAIVSYDKLSTEQLKKMEEAFPDGYAGALTQIKTATGEAQDAIMWETDDIIYLVKLQRPQLQALSLDDEEDDEESEDLMLPNIKSDDMDLEDDDMEDDYDVADDEPDDDEDED